MATAIIIGGSSGIGLAVGEVLVSKGISVVAVARNANKLADAKAALCKAAEKGTAVTTWVADLSDVDNLEGTLLTKIRRLPAGTVVRHLVNSAGIFAPKPFLEHTSEDYRSYHLLNESIFFATQEVCKRMISQGTGGSIVNIGSMWAKQAIKATPSSAYSMAKAGLHALTQHLAMELAESKIRVNAVSPAVVETPVYRAFIADDAMDETMRSFDAFHPIGRTGVPRDVATVVEFLLDDDKTSWVTGAVWDVDGGVMSGRN